MNISHLGNNGDGDCALRTEKTIEFRRRESIQIENKPVKAGSQMPMSRELHLAIVNCVHKASEMLDLQDRRCTNRFELSMADLC